MPSQVDRPPLGLRERKKEKTRVAIQQHALRLFREQGYDATTVEQIADAAEISPRTFFRYFPTKEDVVLYDFLDPLFIEAFKAQPADLSPIQAFRNAFREVIMSLPPEQLALAKDRGVLIIGIPEVRARMLDEFTRTTRLFDEVVAQRVGRSVDDLAVRIFVGAVMGVVASAILAAAESPEADYAQYFDAGLALLEAGLPL